MVLLTNQQYRLGYSLRHTCLFHVHLEFRVLSIGILENEDFMDIFGRMKNTNSFMVKEGRNGERKKDFKYK